MPPKHFATSYMEARAAFRAEAQSAGAVLDVLGLGIPIDGEDEGLSIDIATFGDGPRAVLITSGLHGVEGFAGSAAQRQAIAAGLPNDVRVVMVHALNPWGMHHGRRVNEHNVDLNRNFVPEAEAHGQPADAYRTFDGLLNPPTPPRFDFYLLRCMAMILRHGRPRLKRAIVGGQYEFPQGLFYGGSTLERSAQLLLGDLPARLAGCTHIVAIDFHTGLGKRGTHAILVDHTADDPRHQSIRAHFGDRVQPWQADGGVAYEIRGGWPAALQRGFGDRIEVLTCEFGTLPDVTVLAALRHENQVFHHGGDRAEARRRIMAAFAPMDDASWCHDVLAGAAGVIGQACSRVRHLGA